MWVSNLQADAAGRETWQVWDENGGRCSCAFRACDPNPVPGASLPVCVFTAQFCLWFIGNMSGIQLHCFIQEKHFQRTGGNAVVELYLVAFSVMIMTSKAGFQIVIPAKRFLKNIKKKCYQVWIQQVYRKGINLTPPSPLVAVRLCLYVVKGALLLKLMGIEVIGSRESTCENYFPLGVKEWKQTTFHLLPAGAVLTMY